MRLIKRNMIGAYVLLLIFCESLAHLRLDTPEYHAKVAPAVSFERSAVESVSVLDERLNPFTRAHLREEYLPLRSAVESVPTLDLKAVNKLKASLATRTFIRDSVESLPDDETADLLSTIDNKQSNEHLTKTSISSHENAAPEKIRLENLKASLQSDAMQDEYKSQPYRADSAYQQLIDPSKDIYTLANVKHNIDGNFSEHFDEDSSFYGALAQLKATTKDYSRSTSEVLCYITNWAFYRMADGKFVPENLDTKLCTLVIYSFASLDPDHLTIKEFDNWVDIENQFYERIVNSGVPVLIALGGWTDSAGDKYSRLAADDIKRRVFATSLVSFIQRHNFAGLHLDWNYPKCWQSDCTRGPTADKPNLTKLLREIRNEFNRVNRHYKIGLAISGYKEIITEAYDFPEISHIVDYMTVMSYDYHGSWERQTGHVSPLYGRSSDKYPQYNTDFTMQLITKLGARKDKLIMGIPFYGQSFTLAQHSSSLVGEGIPTVGPGEPGEFTKQPGMLAFYEICQRLRKQKWQSGRDVEGRSGPYAMFRNQWVGYEDAVSVERKVRYAIKNGFGGVAAWTVDLDDFQNRCCSEAFPLLKAINRVLGRITEPPPTRANCERPLQPATPMPPVMTTISSDGSGSAGGHEHHTTVSTTTTPRTTTHSWWSTTAARPITTTRRPQTTTTTTTTTTRRPITTTTRRTTRAPFTTTTSSPSIIVQNEPTAMPQPGGFYPVIPPSQCMPGQFYGDRYNCNAYYLCINYGDLRQQFCSDGLHWNKNSQNCDWPDSARCAAQGTKPTPSYTQPTRRTTTTAPTWTWSYETTTKRPQYFDMQISSQVKPSKRPQRPVSSKCREGEYYSHRSCDKYYICVNGILVPNSCGGNLHWDAIRKICDWPENVQCLTVKSYLKLSRANLIRTNPTDPCNGEERVPYPNDCKKFLFCLWNRFQGGDCGPGLHFNPLINTCDWPSNAHCTENNIETGEVGENGATGGDDNEFVENQFDPPQMVPTKKPIPRPTTTTQPPTIATTTTRPTYPTNKPDLEPLDGYYKLVCYFTNWAWYRKGTGRYTPDNINTDLCTHIVYGFAVLDYSNLVLRTHDSWADIDNNFYTRVSSLKEKGVKVSLALGGWNDSQGDKYSRLVRNPQARARFIQHALEFLEKYGFEGLDLDWEYPVCWQTDCKKGMADEKEGFTALVRELSAAFAPRGLLLSTAVSPSKKIIDAGYDVPQLSKYFDWIAVMTYDFHGQWDKKTGHVAPLFYHPEDDIEYFNANFSLNYWIEKGAPSRKIVMGMPLYGQSFTLENAQNNGLNAKAPGPGQAGEFTRAAGFLAYYEICDRIKNRGWEVVQDVQGRMGPYAHKGNQWVSFDDRAILKKKSQLVRAMNLGGGMVWALDLDDFKNVCGEGVHPLLQQIHNVLKDPPSSYESFPGLTPVETIETPSFENDNSVAMHESHISFEHDHFGEISTNNDDFNSDVELIDDNIGVEELEATESLIKKDFKVVCYFTAWSWYRQNGGKFLPEDIDPDLCTHIIYGFAILDRETLTIRPHDTWADLDNKFYERITAFKAKNIKVSIAIGGWNDSAGDKYSRLVRSLSAIGRFVRHVIEFMEKYGFDGLDLDWEYPVCWQVDCNKGSESERQGFVDLVKELSRAFKPKGYLLSAAVSPNKKVIDNGYNVPELSYYFDWIAVMAYDYHGQWDKKTGHVAPMYDHPMGTSTFNANFTINYWLESGADREKLVMGMPLYGQSFSLAQARDNGLNAPTYGGGEAGQATRARGFLSFYEICSNIQKRGWNVVRDPRGRMGPYAFLRDQWVSFDDIHMIRHKSEYIRAMGLGGAMIWALDLDDFRNICDCESYPLLKTINRVLRDYPEKQGSPCKLEEIEHSRISIDTGLSQAYTAQPTVSNNDIEYPAQDDDKVNNENTDIELFGCESQSFTRHKTDCQKYYICVHGELLEQMCPDGLHWNDHYCDWPQNSKCKFTQYDEDPNIPWIQSSTTSKAPQFITTKPPKLQHKPASLTPIYKPTISPAPNNDDYKVVCYFTAWSWYRPGEGKYLPEDIDENLCTHIVYGFTVLNSKTLTIRTHDSWADLDNKFYERVVAYKKKGIKVTVAIGGWNDSLGNKYSRLVLDPLARERFITSAIEFINKYGFDGLDLDWEYPVCWQVDCSKGSAQEKEAFAEFVRELSEEFKPRGLLLSAAVSPSKKVIDAGYEVPSLAKYFDWIAVMTYDFHGHWDRITGHVAPLYYVDGDTNEYFNANFSINYWIEKGTPPKKLIMGMPLYGQTFALTESKRNSLNSKSVGPGQAGSYTRASGFLAYYEICEKVGNGGWNVVRDPQGRIGPYAYNGNQWVSYDDVSEIRRKAKFLKNMRLGGGMVWALDLDDFKGRCGCGKYPLLQTLNQEIRNIPGQRINDCT